MSMDIKNLTATSFHNKLDNDIGTHDDFDLSLKNDTVADLLDNNDDIEALAEAILEDTGATDIPLSDLVEFIKIQANKTPKNISIQAFMTSVIVDLKELSAEDESLSISELKTGITREQQEVNPVELTTFIRDILTSIADDGKTLKEEDAPLLAALLGIETDDAKVFIQKTQGNIEGLIDIFANGDEKIVYDDLEIISNPNKTS